ncbi:hypothetical protein H0H81_004794 [Sphagnurus paluster]|uniref:Uncharacterized protein n=1 Tax=Sphagnurus paluster TaxID=117069 RepID=A0A9P7FUN9_9AGAR|nr:hypothetical protein H0H81_004794 [Sphagnurus paluster]
MVTTGTTETICATGPTTIPTASNSPLTEPSEVNHEATPTCNKLDGHQYAKKLLNQRHTNKKSATDVWFFIEPLKADAQPPPEGLLVPDIATMKAILDRKPDPKKYPHLRCRLCLVWKTWSNCDGVTGTIRAHLKDPNISQHLPIYLGITKALSLKHHDDEIPRDGPRETFKAEAWLEWLVRWIVVDDQACYMIQSVNVVDVPEFCDFVLFGREDVTEAQLPHWSALTDLIAASYKKRHDELKGIIKAFRIVEGAHDGEHLGDIIFAIWKEAGLLHILGQFTLDNAINNNTTLRRLVFLLNQEGIEYSEDGNCVQ